MQEMWRETFTGNQSGQVRNPSYLQTVTRDYTAQMNKEDNLNTHGGIRG